MKIIITIILCCLQFNFKLHGEIITVSSMSELDSTLQKISISNTDMILLDTYILFQPPERKKRLKKTEYLKQNFQNPIKNKEISKQKSLEIYTLKDPNDVMVVNTLIKKYSSFFVYHRKYYEPIGYFDKSNTNKVLLPVKIYPREKTEPILIGHILYGYFVRLDILIYLLCFYKKIKCKRVILITNQEIDLSLMNQEILIINIKNTKK